MRQHDSDRYETRETCIFLNTGQLNNALVNRSLCDEAVDGNLSGLTKPMSPVHCLRVVRWIPIVVIKDDRIGSGEIDTKTTGSGTEYEDEDIWSGKV